MKPKFILFAFILITAFTEKTPKVLIIGDSISIGYTPSVKKQLGGKAIITHNEGNARDSGHGLENIAKWIQEDEYDVIQFNWGLWDLCYRHPDSKVQGHRDKVTGSLTWSLEAYEAHLEEIVEVLKNQSNAKLIFVTTSYVPPNEAGRFQKDPIKYNKAAKRVMKKHHIMVQDIYKESKKIHKKFGKGNDDVHYKEEGYEKLAEVIAAFLLKEL